MRYLFYLENCRDINLFETMSSIDINVLMDMGFSKIRIEEALNRTGNKGIEVAMEWLLAHPDYDESPSESLQTTNPIETVGTAKSSNTPVATSSHVKESEEVKSIKCDTCGKLFKTNLEIEFHASKSGHDKFSESMDEKRPLTEQEKKQQLQILEDKLRQKRKDREEKEKKEAFERERNRIRSGKEMIESRKRLEELEMKKLMEQRKREKEEDKLTRQKIKEQIEADKIARRSRNIFIDNNLSDPLSLSLLPTSVTTSIRTDYNETKLQIRLTNGQTLIQNFSSKEQLSAVRLFIEMNRTDDSGPFILMTNFPKRVFTENDFEIPLDVLGLVPSAVLIVQKK